MGVIDYLCAGEEVHRRRTNEASGEKIGGMVVEFLRTAKLLDEAAIEHGNTAAHRHGLSLVVRDIHKGCLHALVNFNDLSAHLHAQCGVEIGERLVHQEDLRILAGDGAAKGDALALATGQLFGFALQIVLQTQDFSGFIDALLNLQFGHVAQFEAKSNVVKDSHVGIESVVLENHRDIAIFGVDAVDNAVTDDNFTLGDIFQSCHHTQAGAFAAARGADQDEELFVLDVEIDVVDDLDFVEAFVDMFKLDTSHEGHSFSLL